MGPLRGGDRLATAALRDGPVEQSAGSKRRQQAADGDGAGGLAEHGDVLRKPPNAAMFSATRVRADFRGPRLDLQDLEEQPQQEDAASVPSIQLSPNQTSV